MTVIDAPTLSSHNNVITRISDMMPDIFEVPFDSMSLLGSAIGDGNLDTSIARCTRRVELICQRVRNLDPHWALFLFDTLYFGLNSRYCAASFVCLHETTFAKSY